MLSYKFDNLGVRLLFLLSFRKSSPRSFSKVLKNSSLNILFVTLLYSFSNETYSFNVSLFTISFKFKPEASEFKDEGSKFKNEIKLVNEVSEVLKGWDTPLEKKKVLPLLYLTL